MSLPTRPIFQDELLLGNRNKEEYLLMAVYVIRTLGWQVTNVETTKLHAFTEKDGEVFDVKFVHGTMVFSSKSIDLLTVNESKNRQNLQLFKNTFESQQQHQQKHGELRQDPIPEPQGIDTLINDELDTANDQGLLQLFIPRKGFFITPIICYICIIVFLLMWLTGAGFFDPSTTSLIKWGSNFSPLTLGGEWWRLITSVFVHVGVFHLVLNLFGFIFVAIFLESILGPWRFLAAYLVTGVLASLTSIWWHTLIISAGASGAIFGMYGLFVALLASDLIDKNFRKDGLIYFGVIIFFNLVSGLKEGIDNAAHVGGLISGIIIGYIYYFDLKMPEKVWLKYLTPLLVLALGGSITYFAMQHIPNYMGIYDRNIDQFSSNEKDALRMFDNMNDSATHSYKMYELDHGVKLWQQNMKLIEELEKIPRLPEGYQKDIEMRRAYTEYRERNYRFRYKAESEGTSKYNDSIIRLDNMIDSLIKSNNTVDTSGVKK